MSGSLSSRPRLHLGRLVRVLASRRRHAVADAGGVHRSHARYALGQVLAGLPLPEDSVVLVPSFVCASVVTPLLAHGLEIRAYPVTTGLEPEMNRLRELVDHRTRLLLGIRYFGSSAGMQDLAALCHEAGLIFVEDCAHLLPYDPSQAAAEGWGGLTLYSWRKHLPLADGGSVFLRDPSLLPVRPAPDASPSSWAGSVADLVRHYLGGAVRSRHRVPSRVWTGRTKTALGSRDGRSAPASRSEDFRYSVDEEAKPMRPSSRLLLEHLDVRGAAETRREHARLLAEQIGPLLPEPCFPDLSRVAGGPWALAFRAPSKPLLQHRLRRAGIPAFGWDGVVHPAVAAQLEPAARRLYDEFCFLPVHQDLRPRDLHRIGTEVCRALKG